MTAWTVPLSWRRPPLSLNDRMHHMKRWRIRKEVMDEVYLRLLASNVPRGLGYATLTLHWQPDVIRPRDEDNLYLTVKACADAACRGTRSFNGYGLTPDDTHEHLHTAVKIHPIARRDPKMWLTITDNRYHDPEWRKANFGMWASFEDD